VSLYVNAWRILIDIGLLFSLKSPFEYTSNEFRIGYSLNFDGPGHPGLGRDIRVWIDF